MVVAQLVERLLHTPEIFGLNPVVGNLIYFQLLLISCIPRKDETFLLICIFKNAANKSFQGTEEKSSGEKSEKEEGETFGTKMENVGKAIKEEFDKDVDKLAEVTHMKPW